ncbi:NADPH-dependent F420 reductase [Jatrophihabitans sp. YIM 134969]
MIIGLIGAGHIGTAVARNAIRSGHQVVLSNSRGPDTLGDLVAELGSSARAATAEEAARAGDIVVVTIPFKAVPQVPIEPLAGKTVIDTNNYYFERDGRFADIDGGTQTVSGTLQEHLPTSKVVKAFNQIQAAHLAAGGAGTSGPRAIPIAGDDAGAKAEVAELIGSWGFDVVDAGPLAAGATFDRDQPAYGFDGDAAALQAKLDEAKPNAFASI